EDSECAVVVCHPRCGVARKLDRQLAVSAIPNWARETRRARKLFSRPCVHGGCEQVEETRRIDEVRAPIEEADVPRLASSLHPRNHHVEWERAYLDVNADPLEVLLDDHCLPLAERGRRRLAGVENGVMAAAAREAACHR